MDKQAAVDRLCQLWVEIEDLNSAEELLEWDQETYMPAGGQERRGKVLGTLAAIKHQRLAAPELGDVLAACAQLAGDDPEVAAMVRCARREVDRATLVSGDLMRALAEAKSVGMVAWRAARKQADFSLFAGQLEELVRLKREQAAALLPGGRAYDALLDIFEPGATEATLEPLFSSLRDDLTPIVREVAERRVEVDESPALGHFDEAAQLDFGRSVAQSIGFDFERGRLDPATHPFCIAIGRRDVRMTWRWQEDDFRPALFGIMHETGHGLYEQGLPEKLGSLPHGDAASLGVHESQSRLWENHVGRSRGFWQWALPRLGAAFPRQAMPDLDQLWPALHTVKPSLIRVDADEATYNLHIVIRFEIERVLFSGDLEVADLPHFWDHQYDSLLGIRPADPAQGVLQDIHWSIGLFGYFPTYTLGTMAAAQLFAAAERELGDQEAAFAAGEFGDLLGWLRRQVHSHGSLLPADELIERATGKPLAADDLLHYLKQTTAAAYPA